MNTREQQISETIESLNNIRRAESNPFLHEKIMQRIRNEGTGTFDVRPRINWRVAALVAILVSFNLATIIYLNKTSSPSRDKVASLANEYFSYMGTIKF